MKYKQLIILFFSFVLIGCEQYNSKNSQILNKDISTYYKNTGFALVYNNDLDIKKLDQRSLSIFHGSLKKKSFVKVTNPNNNKSLIAEVKSNKENFSNFYNSIISLRIAQTLDLDLNEPFVEISLISKNSTFVAKKAKTFNEEKNVAEKAPIDGVKISNLSSNKPINDTKKRNKVFSYSIKVADFYYEDTAQIVVDRISKETSLSNLKIIRLSPNNYRVLIGPFNDIISLKKSFEIIKSLYFENLEIIKNV